MNCNDTDAGYIKEMTSILVDAFNKSQDDAEKCRRLAEYMFGQLKRLKDSGLLTEAFHLWRALEEIIYSYGEPIDDIYTGRDEDGEKTFHCFNPETNWDTRVRKILWPLMNEIGIN